MGHLAQAPCNQLQCGHLSHGDSGLYPRQCDVSNGQSNVCTGAGAAAALGGLARQSAAAWVATGSAGPVGTLPALLHACCGVT
eukprot:5652061-Karenia_brevis.AAC.1